MQQQNQNQQTEQLDHTRTAGENEAEAQRRFIEDLNQRAYNIYCNNASRIRGKELKPGTQWTAAEANWYIQIRAANVLNRQLVIDENNRNLYNLLCFYFSYDKRFYELATHMNVKNPDLEKGILLAGNVGVGKTFLMQLFAINFRQCYRVVSAKKMANDYEEGGQEYISDYMVWSKASNSSSEFYQHFRGLCIDDIGTEDPKVYMGNRKNVIGDVVEARYERKCVGHWFHGTTNLTPKELDDYYQARVSSRLRQVVNLIELGGEDRRRSEPMFPAATISEAPKMAMVY